MSTTPHQQNQRREKTLRTALLLSMWAPLTTGIAVLMSQSTTQLADFIRRSVELLAIFTSWWVFRYISQKQDFDQNKKQALEKLANYFVSGAMLFSALVMITLVLIRFESFQPGGNVTLGIIIAFLGLGVNSWFFWRYHTFNREKPDAIINAQKTLYRAKSVVDLCVLIPLITIALASELSIAKYLDLLGSIIVACYLLWSSYSLLRPHQKSA